MKLVERHIIRNDRAIERICFNAARLYNYSLYQIRQSFFRDENVSCFDLIKQLASENQFDFRNLPAQTSQEIIKLLFKNWKAFYRASKDYEKHPGRYTGKPHIPKYKDKKGFGICIFTNQQVKLKSGFIHFPAAAGLNPLKTRIEKIQQVRLIPQATCFVIEVVYNKEKEVQDVEKERFLSIDLGLNNLATCVSNAGEPFIANGKVIKSKNQYFNKKRAELQSYIGSKGTSNKIKRLTHYRNNFIDDKMHKVSRRIVNFCLAHRIGTIIIGNNEDWKRSLTLGKRNNQNFVNIPHGKLIDKIMYKSELVGIEVKLPEESYTSKIDHLAFESLNHHDTYIGKRKFRGLFQSSSGKLINADVNGAIGIARKVFGDSAVSQIAGSGFALNPIRINI
ncbi:MAG: transposase [Paludibacter sp.]|nr:transposase [Paludibacter sp.]